MAERDRIKRLIFSPSTHRQTHQQMSMRPQATKEAIHKFLFRTPPPDILIDVPSSIGSTTTTTATTTTSTTRTNSNPHQAVRRRPFFLKLTPELRRHLYILAFGNEGPGCAPWEDRCDRDYGRALDGVAGSDWGYWVVVELSVGVREDHRRPILIQLRQSTATADPSTPRYTRVHYLPRTNPSGPAARIARVISMLTAPKDISRPTQTVSLGRREVSGISQPRADRIARKLLAHPSRLGVFELAVRHSTFRHHLIAGLGEE
ncbi:hypothetical protein ACJ73_03197 [Blastomyces percursus]|uniref:Uncharacterized protein n=1 Tax=Blastomyces percursus TaxID=1658174 RepID=A0A1J9RA84_9EURO|nr:hypothetical protein ACJ73_03197 [Blastomyces percursus]